MNSHPADMGRSFLTLKGELVSFFHEPVTQEQVIRDLAARLFKGGFVHASYGQAVLDRERVFPTGLPTVPFGIAIPHTDSEHVYLGAVAVAILTHPVEFLEMGGEEGKTVAAHIVMALAIAQPEAVAGVLRQLALGFQDGDFLEGLKHASDPAMVIRIITSRLPDVIQS